MVSKLDTAAPIIPSLDIAPPSSNNNLSNNKETTSNGGGMGGAQELSKFDDDLDLL